MNGNMKNENLTIERALSVIKYYNKWRTSDGTDEMEMPKPHLVTVSLDLLIRYVEQKLKENES